MIFEDTPTFLQLTLALAAEHILDMFSGAKLALGYVLTSIMNRFMERETHLNLDYRGLVGHILNVFRMAVCFFGLITSQFI